MSGITSMEVKKMTKKTLLIIDDHQGFRQVLKSFIAKQFQDVGIKEAATGEEGLQLAVQERPDVALVDVNLPGMDGLQAAKWIKEAVPACQIVTMSMFGGKGYVLKESAAFIEKSQIDNKLVPLLKKLLLNGKVER